MGVEEELCLFAVSVLLGAEPRTPSLCKASCNEGAPPFLRFTFILFMATNSSLHFFFLQFFFLCQTSEGKVLKGGRWRWRWGILERKKGSLWVFVF